MRILPVTVAVALCFPAFAQEPAQKPQRPLAESGPRAEPVKQPDPADIDKALRRGIAFLIKTQNKDGSWGSAALRGGIEIYAPIPGGHQAFHTAVTAMCISALIETGGDTSEVRTAIERGETWLMEHLPKL